MSFVIKDVRVLNNYNKISNKNKKALNIRFHCMPVYDEKYIRAKVREFGGAIKTNFLSNDIPNGKVHYFCIAYITIDSVMRMEKNYPQVYLEECKCKIKKIKMSKFINTELESESESELESDTGLKSNSELESDSE